MNPQPAPIQVPTGPATVMNGVVMAFQGDTETDSNSLRAGLGTNIKYDVNVNFPDGTVLPIKGIAPHQPRPNYMINPTPIGTCCVVFMVGDMIQFQVQETVSPANCT